MTHEMAIVRDLMDWLERFEREEGKTVRSIVVCINPLTGYEKEDTELCFEVVKKEKGREELEIRVEVEYPEGECLGCGKRFIVQEYPTICPECESAQVRVMEMTPMKVVEIG